MQYLPSDPYSQNRPVDNGPGAALAGIGNVFGDPMQNALQQQKQALTAREIAGQGQLGSIFAQSGALSPSVDAAAVANGVTPEQIFAAHGAAFLNGGLNSAVGNNALAAAGKYPSSPASQQAAEQAKMAETTQAASIAAAAQLRTAGLEPVQITNPDGSTGWTTKAAIAQGQAPTGAQPLISPDMVKGAILAHGVLPQPGGAAPAPMTDDQRALAMPAETQPKFQVTGEDAYGNKVYGYPPAPPAAGAAPAPAPGSPTSPIASPADASAAMNLHGDDFLKTLDPQIAGQVQSIIEGRTPYPTGMLLKTPYGQKLAAFVTQADPSFEAGNATARVKARADFGTGGPNGVAGTITAGNSALKHLGALSDLIPGLNNYNSAIPGTTIVNGIKNAVNSTDSNGAQLGQYNDINGRLAEEMTKFYRGTGGTEADVARDMANISPNMTPTQLNAGVAALTKLAQGKIDTLQSRWHNVMGPQVADYPIVDAQAQHAIDTVMARAGGQTGGVANPPNIPTLPGVTPPAPQGAFDGPVTPVGTVKQGKGGVSYIRLPGGEYDNSSWKALPSGGK